MSKSRKDSTHSTQLSLSFDPTFGTLGEALDRAAAEVSEAIRLSTLSREQILDRLAILLGRQVSKAQFDAWTAETNRNRMPADVLVGVCYVLGIGKPIDTLLAPARLHVATERDQALAELGRKGLQPETLDAEIAELKRWVGGR